VSECGCTGTGVERETEGREIVWRESEIQKRKREREKKV
jgi:hypothetical protein